MSALVPIPPDRENWIKTAQAAQLAGIRPETLLAWYRANKPGLPRPKKINDKCYRWPRLALIRWFESTGQAEGQGDA